MHLGRPAGKKERKTYEMALPLEPLTGTEDLGESARCGIQKHWPFKSKTDDSLHWDYVQKANYAVQDFNETIANKTRLTREDIVFAITLVDWICDAVDKVLQCYRGEIAAGFTYTRQDELNRMHKYFRAVRSFVNAHPLGTNRHHDFGLDGTYFCIDIRGKSRLLEVLGSDFRKLTPNGMEHADSLEDADVVLYAYSNNDGGMCFHHIGIDLADVRRVAELCIAKLYELDSYLGALKKRDFSS